MQSRKNVMVEPHPIARICLPKRDILLHLHLMKKIPMMERCITAITEHGRERLSL